MFFFNSSIKVSESGVLRGFTDYHCHLLPGVDDGVQKEEDTRQLLSMMEQQGVANVWFTPHVMEDVPNRPEGLRKVFGDFQYDGGIRLHLSAENMLDSDFSMERAKELPHIDNHVLVETSYFTAPYNFHGVLKQIMSAGTFPMLAHPCRYQYMEQSDYEELREMGVHFQLNVPALCGLYGATAEKKARWLLKNGYYEVTGTDTHSVKQYGIFLDSKMKKSDVKLLEELIGRQ